MEKYCESWERLLNKYNCYQVIEKNTWGTTKQSPWGFFNTVDFETLCLITSK